MQAHRWGQEKIKKIFDTYSESVYIESVRRAEGKKPAYNLQIVGRNGHEN